MSFRSAKKIVVPPPNSAPGLRRCVARHHSYFLWFWPLAKCNSIPLIYKETSAGSCNLLNVKIVLFTTGNFYCLLTRLRKSIKVLVISTCASPIRLSAESQRNFYKNTKVGVDYIDQILEMFITKFSTRC